MIEEVIQWANSNEGFLGLIFGLLPLTVLVLNYGFVGTRVLLGSILNKIRFSSIFRIFNKKTNKTIRIATFAKTFGYLPFEIAKNKGFFSKEFADYKIEYLSYATFEEIVNAVNENKIDILFCAVAPAIKLADKNIFLKIFDVSCIYTQYLITNAREIRKIRDFENNTPLVMTTEFSSSHIGMLELFKKNNVENQAIKVEFGKAEDCRNKFRNRETDVWAVWSPFSDIELEDNEVWRINGSEFSIYSVVCILNDDRINRKILLTKNALLKAKMWIDNNKRQARLFTSITYKVSNFIIRQIWNDFNFVERLDKFAENEIALTLGLMKEKNIIETTELKVADIIYEGK